MKRRSFLAGLLAIVGIGATREHGIKCGFASKPYTIARDKYAELLQRGMLTTNEVRQREGLSKIGDPWPDTVPKVTLSEIKRVGPGHYIGTWRVDS